MYTHVDSYDKQCAHRTTLFYGYIFRRTVRKLGTVFLRCLLLHNLITYVTAAGWRAGNTRFTFMLAGVGSDRCTRQVVTATQSSITVMNTISTLMGRHALASPKGGGPCSLGTFNYGVVSHLAFQLT